MAMKHVNGSCLQGFTLIELLVSMAIAGIVAGIIINTFINHQNSYRAQLQIAGLQQNLRTALSLISDDIRKSGHYTALDGRTHGDYVDWNPEESGFDSFSRSLYGVNDITGRERHVEHSDLIMIVKSGDDRGRLQYGEHVESGRRVLHLQDSDLDNDGDDDLNSSGKRFGILVKSDLSIAHIFKISAVASGSGGSMSAFHVSENVPEYYSPGDIVARVDIIIYRVDNANPSFSSSVLERKNAGRGNTFQVVAEDITNIQFAYLLKDGRLVDDPSGEEGEIAGVDIQLEGEVNVTGVGIKRRRLETMVRIRNSVL